MSQRGIERYDLVDMPSHAYEPLDRKMKVTDGGDWVRSSDYDALLERVKALEVACHAFCSTMAFTPSSVPGAIERDLNAAYNMARSALSAPPEKGDTYG